MKSYYFLPFISKDVLLAIKFRECVQFFSSCTCYKSGSLKLARLGHVACRGKTSTLCYSFIFLDFPNDIFQSEAQKQ